MNTLRQSLLIISCLLLSHLLYGQSRGFIQLKGLVLEEKTAERVPFATVRIRGSAVGTITDLKGSFSFWISEKYKPGTLILSSVGYLTREIPVVDLNPGVVNRIIMKPDTVDLGQVTVVRDKKLKPLDVLRKAIARIPKNYQNQIMYYDAYYRERVLENGAIIKYADAAVNFEQSPYDGRKYKQELVGGGEWKSSKRYGTWLASYGGLGRARDRLHDHFGHKTSKNDRVQILEARISQNNTREQLQANIEAGPLGTLSKDLVKYLAHFMDSKNFKDYVFELMEVPGEGGVWDYLVKFKPKKAPRPLEEILAEGGRTSREDILSGEIYIDKDSFVIKKMNYRVGQKHRRHICNLQLMSIKHYGYQVDVDYMQNDGKWQMKQIKRVDEFIFKDTISQKNTPYSAISEIFVIKPNTESTGIPDLANYRNEDHNSLQSYEARYHPEFWEAYQQRVPVANLKTSLQAEELGDLDLQSQFAQMTVRNKNQSPPVAEVKPDGNGDDYDWLRQEGEALKAYVRLENDFSDNYFRPLKKVQRALLMEFSIADRYVPHADSLKSQSFDSWSDFKQRHKRGSQYHVWEFKTDRSDGGKVDISLIFTGKDKDRWLKERPALISLSSEKTGLKMKFDPSLMPLLNRGVVLVYVHLKELKDSEKRVNWKDRLSAVDGLIDAVKYLKKNGQVHPEKAFVQGTGLRGGIIASTVNKEPGLFQGVLLDHGRFDPEGRLAGGLRNGKMTDAQDYSPYRNIKTQAYPNMAFFTSLKDTAYWESVKTVARLRALKNDQNVLLLKTDFDTGHETSIDPLMLNTYKYAVMFQWIDDLDSSKK